MSEQYEKTTREQFNDCIDEVLSKYFNEPNRVNAEIYINKICDRLRGIKGKSDRIIPQMSEVDRILKGYDCCNGYETPNCDKCRYGYSEVHYRANICQGSAVIASDMRDMLTYTQGIMAVLMFLLEEYSKPDAEKRVVPFKTQEGLAKFFHFLLAIVYHDNFE